MLCLRLSTDIHEYTECEWVCVYVSVSRGSQELWVLSLFFIWFLFSKLLLLGPREMA